MDDVPLWYLAQVASFANLLPPPHNVFDVQTKQCVVNSGKEDTALPEFSHGTITLNTDPVGSEFAASRQPATNDF